MEKSARKYHCARCHTLVVICSDCDRGNIYCGTSCSQQAYVLNHRMANQAYQKTLKGRQKHAARQQRYRQRQKEKVKKVTDMGSNDLPVHDLLLAKPSGNTSWPIELRHCHFCGETVSPFLRNGFLRDLRKHQSNDFSSWPLGS